jgi:hypothetical protein
MEWLFVYQWHTYEVATGDAISYLLLAAIFLCWLRTSFTVHTKSVKNKKGERKGHYKSHEEYNFINPFDESKP